MKLTSAEAGKLLRSLKAELDDIRGDESRSYIYTVANGEDAGALRPEYDYATTQSQIIELDDKIRKLKHAINVFNSTTVIPEYNMTIDEMLIYLPQLSKRKDKYSSMKSRQPKQRHQERYRDPGPIIEYEYANYDIPAVVDDYKAVIKEISRAQTALDTINNTVSFEFDF